MAGPARRRTSRPGSRRPGHLAGEEPGQRQRWATMRAVAIGRSSADGPQAVGGIRARRRRRSRASRPASQREQRRGRRRWGAELARERDGPVGGGTEEAPSRRREVVGGVRDELEALGGWRRPGGGRLGAARQVRPGCGGMAAGPRRSAAPRGAELREKDACLAPRIGIGDVGQPQRPAVDAAALRRRPVAVHLARGVQDDRRWREGGSARGTSTPALPTALPVERRREGAGGGSSPTLAGAASPRSSGARRDALEVSRRAIEDPPSGVQEPGTTRYTLLSCAVAVVAGLEALDLDPRVSGI